MISSLFVLVFYYPRVKLGLDHEVLVICVQGLPYLGKERILVGHVAVTPLSAHAVLAPVTGEEYCIGSSLKFVSAGASPAQLLVKLPLFHRLGEALTAAESCCLSHIFNVKLLNGLILVEAKLNLVVLLRDYAALVVGLPVLGDSIVLLLRAVKCLHIGGILLIECPQSSAPFTEVFKIFLALFFVSFGLESVANLLKLLGKIGTAVGNTLLEGLFSEGDELLKIVGVKEPCAVVVVKSVPVGVGNLGSVESVKLVMLKLIFL